MSKTIVERAFELARSGQCRTISDIQRRLSRERYEDVHGHLSGAGTMRQLRQLMRQNCSTATYFDAINIDPASSQSALCEKIL